MAHIFEKHIIPPEASTYEDRLKVYQELHYIIKDTDLISGLCIEICYGALHGAGFCFSTVSKVQEWPELKSYKPYLTYSDGYWWRRRNKKIRRKVAKRLSEGKLGNFWWKIRLAR